MRGIVISEPVTPIGHDLPKVLPNKLKQSTRDASDRFGMTMDTQTGDWSHSSHRQGPFNLKRMHMKISGPIQALEANRLPNLTSRTPKPNALNCRLKHQAVATELDETFASQPRPSASRGRRLRDQLQLDAANYSAAVSPIASLSTSPVAAANGVNTCSAEINGVSKNSLRRNVQPQRQKDYEQAKMPLNFVNISASTQTVTKQNPFSSTVSGAHVEMGAFPAGKVNIRLHEESETALLTDNSPGDTEVHNSRERFSLPLPAEIHSTNKNRKLVIKRSQIQMLQQRHSNITPTSRHVVQTETDEIVAQKALPPVRSPSSISSTPKLTKIYFKKPSKLDADESRVAPGFQTTLKLQNQMQSSSRQMQQNFDSQRFFSIQSRSSVMSLVPKNLTDAFHIQKQKVRKNSNVSSISNPTDATAPKKEFFAIFKSQIDENKNHSGIGQPNKATVFDAVEESRIIQIQTAMVDSMPNLDQKSVQRQIKQKKEEFFGNSRERASNSFLLDNSARMLLNVSSEMPTVEQSTSQEFNMMLNFNKTIQAESSTTRNPFLLATTAQDSSNNFSSEKQTANFSLGRVREVDMTLNDGINMEAFSRNLTQVNQGLYSADASPQFNIRANSLTQNILEVTGNGERQLTKVSSCSKTADSKSSLSSDDSYEEIMVSFKRRVEPTRSDPMDSEQDSTVNQLKQVSKLLKIQSVESPGKLKKQLNQPLKTLQQYGHNFSFNNRTLTKITEASAAKCPVATEARKNREESDDSKSDEQEVNIELYLTENDLARYRDKKRRASKLSKNQLKVVQEQCEMLDRRAEDRRIQKEMEWRRFRDPAVPKPAQQSPTSKKSTSTALLAALAGQVKNLCQKKQQVGSSEQMNKVQKLKRLQQIQQEIDQKRAELAQISEKTVETSDLDEQKAQQLLEKIIKERGEKSMTESIARMQGRTGMFIASLVEDVDAKNEVYKKRRNISLDLNHLTRQKNEIVSALRLEELKKVKIKTQANKQMKSLKQTLLAQLMGSIEPTIDVPPRKTPIVEKFQSAVRKVMPKRTGIIELIKQVLAKDAAARKKRKDRLKWQKIVKKHFFRQKTNQLDMNYIIKVLTMQEVIARIFKNDGDNLGIYHQLGFNLWSNDFLEEKKQFLDDKGLPIGSLFNFNQGQDILKDFDQLFDDKLSLLKFYEHAKDRKQVSGEDNMRAVNQSYLESCRVTHQLPIPLFTNIRNRNLHLSEINITVEMAEALAQYLLAAKDIDSKTIESICIDDCAMTDNHLRVILRSLHAQGAHLKKLSYVNNTSLGGESIKMLAKMMPQMDEIIVHNLRKPLSSNDVHDLVDVITKDGAGLFKLKLSKMNLGDARIMSKLCSLQVQSKFLTSLDLSWANLSPRLLLQLSECLAVNVSKTPLRDLNLSYNTLSWDEKSTDHEYSEDFIDNMAKFISQSTSLTHLDLSAMNLLREPSLMIAHACVKCIQLSALHLSDNGVRKDTEWTDELLDVFGMSSLPSKDATDKLLWNMQTSKPAELRKIVQNALLEDQQMIVQFDQSDPYLYSKRLFQTKQGRTLNKTKQLNMSMAMNGIGRNESSRIDDFVVSRKINQPELIFNQAIHLDSYFEDGASEKWTFQDGLSNSMNGCSICHKHKFTVVFFEQETHELANMELVQIKNAQIVNEVYKSLNISFKDQKEMAPLICGTIVNGQFHRKLRMLRADLFSMLSVCQSMNISNSFKAARSIRNGLIEMIKRTQDIPADDETSQTFQGWEKDLILDKCKHNQAMDVMTVNMPEIWEAKQALRLKKATERQKKLIDKYDSLEKSDAVCSTYAYAAHLPPGLHSFLIYCPKTKRLFCKEVFVDLASSHYFPEYPRQRMPKKQPKSNSNVWRTWREDSEMDIKMALQSDMTERNFQPQLFLKRPNDVEYCVELLEKYFDKIKIIHVENMAHSPTTYPEICFDQLYKYLQKCQTFGEAQRLDKGKIELAHIRATRNDDTKGLRGTLCRGEFFECLLRLAFAWSNQPKILSDYLEQFFEIYVDQAFEQSQIIPIRKMIRASKPLNDLLHDNTEGLRVLYKECMERNKGFTLDSARKFFRMATDETGGDNLVEDTRVHFVYCQMTNLKDSENIKKYYQLAFVELLEMLARVAHSYWKMREQKKLPREEEGVSPYPEKIEQQVEDILIKIWERKMSQQQQRQNQSNPNSGRRNKVKEFPAFVPLDPDDSDEDQ